MNFKNGFSICLLFVTVIKCTKNLKEAGVVLRMEKVACGCEPTLGNITCKTKLISRSLALTNVLLTTFKPITYFKYRVKTYHQSSNNEYRPMLVDAEEEFCETFATKKFSVIQEVLLKVLGSHTNINRPCPFKPDVYYIKDLNIQINDLPSVVPEGRYILNITSHGKSKNFLVYLAYYFHITNHGILDLNVG